MKSPIIAIILFQVFVPMLIHSRIVPLHLNEEIIRKITDSEFAKQLSSYVTLYNITEYIKDRDSIDVIRSCYLSEEKKYKEIIDIFADDLNRVFNSIKEKYERIYTKIVSEIQTYLYNLLNKMRSQPFDLYKKLKSGNKEELKEFLRTTWLEVSFCDYIFDVLRQKLLQQSKNDYQAKRYDERIIIYHKETFERSRVILENIETCIKANLNA